MSHGLRGIATFARRVRGPIFAPSNRHHATRMRAWIDVGRRSRRFIVRSLVTAVPRADLDGFAIAIVFVGL